MTNKERVYAALNHQQPDKCPWHIEFTEGAHESMVALTGDPDFDSKIGNHLHYIRPVPPDSWVEIAPDFWRDQFGVIWNRTIDADIGNPDSHIFPEPTLGDYVWPDPADPRRWAHVPGQIAAHPDQFVVLAIDFSLFERAWTMRGMENLLMDMIEHPAFVEDLLDAITAFNLGIVAEAARYPADAIYFGDDWGQQQAMLMGPALWRQFLKPRLAQAYAAVHATGKRVFIHSCGKVDMIFPDLIEIGLDCFNPFQPEVIDVFAAKREFGDRLSFYGGVSTQHLLPHGTPAEVKAQARRLMAEVGKDGGYIIAPAHATPKDAPAANMMALIEAVNEQ
ncbi:MAG TPA: uroporphyrinogen decarboxylase family protein [Armatimonadota bacterium]|jgi:uroporphyrinogen decarboxylase